MDLTNLYHEIRSDAAVQTLTIGEREYTSRAIVPVKEPEPGTLRLSTLTGLAEYLTVNVDDHEIKNLICHVETPTIVSIVSALTGTFEQRFRYAEADFHLHSGHNDDSGVYSDVYNLGEIGEFMDAEKFNIWMQAHFQETDDSKLILKYVGGVKSSAVQTVGDDGVKQQITTKTGVATVSDVIIPNPVALRPFRTFNEVAQPESKFIFRAQQGPRFALFVADNGKWQLEAKQNIKEFMQKAVPGLHVIA